MFNDSYLHETKVKKTNQQRILMKSYIVITVKLENLVR